jgi:hypothetical protein
VSAEILKEIIILLLAGKRLFMQPDYLSSVKIPEQPIIVGV